MLYPVFHQLPKIVQSYHAHATRFYRRSFFRQRKKYDANVRNKKITNNKKHLIYTFIGNRGNILKNLLI